MRLTQLFEHPPVRSARWWVFDALVTVFVAGTSVGDVVRAHTWQVWLPLLCLPIVVRRIWPTAVFGYVLVAAAAVGIWDVRLIPGPALAVALYTVASRRPRRETLVAVGLAELLVVFAVVRLAGSQWWDAAIFGSGLVAAAVGLGLYSATRRAYLTELRDRADRLERERDQQHELSAAAERARITGEMHDILAHHLSVIVALSDGAAATVLASPTQAIEVMRNVAATGRKALSETRHLLGNLGTDADSASNRKPVPDLAGLDDLVAAVRAAGLPVSYEVQGAVPDLSGTAQLTVYRLVQEALTNTLKHGGPGASATVRLRYLPERVELVIEDDGAGQRGAGLVGGQPGAGRGLSGMRQRVQAFGGDVQSGPRSPSGWRVAAQLRLEEKAAT